VDDTIGLPRLSVVVPTRNRPADASDCIRSILQAGAFDELLVVDQSDDRATEEAIAALGDSRVRRLPSRLRGATNARNAGIEASSGDVIAFTDDDCRVAPDWTASISRLFAMDPHAAVVCGRVHVPAELARQGFAVSFEPHVREWQGRFPPPERDWGITANFAVRREVFAQVGPFDGLLGPGAPLVCGEEPDFLFRVLKAGLKIVNASEVMVEHLGVRAHGAESTRLWRIYAAGTGAAIFKHVRLGDPDAVFLYLRHLLGCVRLVSTNVLHLRRPVGVGYTLAFLSGATASLRFRIDRKRRLYIARETQ
jgi:glycosyltransferase involved in cell wall biosynthesis